MKKLSKKSSKKPVTTVEFRPYRVLFLVIVVSVTCIVLFALLGVSTDW